MWRAGCGANSHVRFGGRARETDRLEGRHRALVRPYAKSIVLCMDEKSSVQALDRTQASLPMVRGRAATMTHHYKRNGTTTLFAALDVLTGKVIGSCLPRHRHEEFIKFLNVVNREVLKGLEVHMILDNYATHKHADVQQWLAKHKRFHCISPRRRRPG